MPTELEMVVIIQAAPTDWIKDPKFEDRLAIQMLRNVSFLNGAKGDFRSVTASTFLFRQGRFGSHILQAIIPATPVAQRVLRSETARSHNFRQLKFARKLQFFWKIWRFCSQTSLMCCKNCLVFIRKPVVKPVFLLRYC